MNGFLNRRKQRKQRFLFSVLCSLRVLLFKIRDRASGLIANQVTARRSLALPFSTCSGSREDHCEVDPARLCAWQLIYLRLKEIGQLDQLKQTKPPKNWRSSRSGGCRTILREDHRV